MGKKIRITRFESGRRLWREKFPKHLRIMRVVQLAVWMLRRWEKMYGGGKKLERRH